MTSVFVIGLPIALRRRLEAEAVRNGLRIVATFSDLDRGNRFRLLPYPGQALSDLRTFADAADDWRQLTVVVLPYAPIPVDVMEELEVLISGGTNVIGLTAASSTNQYWPELVNAVDDEFLDIIYVKVADALFPRRTLLPSDHFNRLCRRNRALLLADGSLDQCDDVSPERYPFLIAAANAFEKIIRKNQLGERFFTFFQSIGIYLAQTGGMHTELLVTKEGKNIYKKRHQMHVKLGDGLAPQMCARVYFHNFLVDTSCHIAVMYAGPHPDDDTELERTIDL